MTGGLLSDFNLTNITQYVLFNRRNLRASRYTCNNKIDIESTKEYLDLAIYTKQFISTNNDKEQESDFSYIINMLENNANVDILTKSHLIIEMLDYVANIQNEQSKALFILKIFYKAAKTKRNIFLSAIESEGIRIYFRYLKDSQYCQVVHTIIHRLLVIKNSTIINNFCEKILILSKKSLKTSQ